MTAPAQAASVSTELVMLAILELTHTNPEAQFTTRDVAQEMGAKEYAVRLAFSWLCRFGKIEIVEGKIIERKTRTAGEKYPVSVYRIKPKAMTGEALDALYKAFGLATARAAA
jgi:hypothetical protein